MSRLIVIGVAGSVLALAVLAPACSGGAREGTAQPAQPAQSREDREAAALASLEKRQEAACEGVGKTLFACAVEDARASMSPDEFAKLEPEKLEPEYMSRFLDECLSSDMSPRQVDVYEGCLQDKRCAVFVPCLDSARPHQPAAAPESDQDGR
jgi:hypothetical protein